MGEGGGVKHCLITNAKLKHNELKLSNKSNKKFEANGRQ